MRQDLIDKAIDQWLRRNVHVPVIQALGRPTELTKAVPVFRSVHFAIKAAKLVTVLKHKSCFSQR